jgi:hypothetical protein
MERYSRQGLPPRRASEAKNYALLLLGDLKWIAPEKYRDFLFTPDMLLVEQRITMEHMLNFMKENPDPRRNDRNLREGMALAALGSCKMALRYAPQRLPEMVRFFNSTFGEHITLQLGHYRATEAASGDHSAYYWDFEIAKLRMEEYPPLHDLYMCIELRSLAARNTFGDWKIQGLLRGWRREALAIIREIKDRSPGAGQGEMVAQVAG